MLDFINEIAPNEITESLFSLKSKYKNIDLINLGKSVKSQKIYAVSIGNKSASSLFLGGMRSCDWFSCGILLRLIECLSIGLASGEFVLSMDIKKLFENKGVFIIPCVNPDGITIHNDNLHWIGNSNGTEIYNNFDIGFTPTSQGITGVNSGKFPNSEKESVALLNFVKTYKLTKAVHFMSGEEKLRYRFGYETPNSARLMAYILSSSCGYTVEEKKNTKPIGTFCDWFTGHLNLPAFEIYMGKSHKTLSRHDIEPVFTRLLESLLLAIIC